MEKLPHHLKLHWDKHRRLLLEQAVKKARAKRMEYIAVKDLTELTGVTRCALYKWMHFRDCLPERVTFARKKVMICHGKKVPTVRTYLGWRVKDLAQKLEGAI